MALRDTKGRFTAKKLTKNKCKRSRSTCNDRGPCAKDSTIGSSKPLQLTDKVDTKTGQIVIFRHEDYVVPCCGAISEWNAYIKNPGTIRLQVWRGLGTGEYTLVGENLATYHKKEENNLIKVTVEEVKQIAVKEGDLLGWYNEDAPMISYKKDSKAAGVLIKAVKKPMLVEDIVDLSSVQASDPRSYAISATVSKGLKPKFKNLPSSITIVSDLAPKTEIYQLGFDGVDGTEVPASFAAFLDDFSEYFAYNQSKNSVYIKRTPPKEKYSLSFTVKDLCGNTDTKALKIEVITKLPAILNLPFAVSVREDAHNAEIVLHEIEVVHTGPTACSLKGVEPVAGRKYFLVRNSNGSAPVVILKATAHLSYAQEDSYELFIKCAAGKESDINSLFVNVEPNKAPIFMNLPATVPVHADKGIIGGLIFHILYQDEEDNPVFYNITCDPEPCPFDVTQGGSIMVTDDLRTAISNIYYIEISIEDHFNVAGPEVLIVNITGLNSPPIIYNIPNKASVNLPENSPPGTSVFQVQAIDQDVDDNLTFSLNAKPTNMIPLFSIDEFTGVIHALVPFDYEGLKSKNIKLYPSVFDGQDTYQGNIKLSIIDVNEPPVFQYPNYTIFTSESGPGKTVVKNRIKAKDNDKGDVIIYGLNCGEETDLFLINEHSADIEQSYELDVDKLGVPEHEIFCIVTATDSVGQMSNASVRFVITDEDDNAPDFIQTSYLFIATKDLPIFSIVGQAYAVDLDTTSVNSKLFYYIEQETDEFVTDDNGTIHLTTDLTNTEVGTMFKFTMRVEDGQGKKDAAPVTVVVLDGDYNTVISSLVARPLTFFDMPENIVWFLTTIYLLLVLFGLLLYLCGRSVRCSIDIQPRSRESRRGKEDSYLKGFILNNLLRSKSSSRRSSIVSVIPFEQTPYPLRTIEYEYHKNSMTGSHMSETSARKRSTKSCADDSSERRLSINKISNRSAESVAKQPISSLNNGVTPDNVIGRNSVVSKMSSVDLPSVQSRISLSDIYPTEDHAPSPWKPWAISDFKKAFKKANTNDSNYLSKLQSKGDKSYTGKRKASLNF
ncbi:protocadherin Fat 3-like [Ruditapes philippinarum]|uniref:protocadherin Fat 3-like n=1 Tax=Ruditapes philippinarum TaxID=129788 RepID=UPI00295AD9A0|nr:protocadherin Fat 3-like [Ruditapes philippinarum]